MSLRTAAAELAAAAWPLGEESSAPLPLPLAEAEPPFVLAEELLLWFRVPTTAPTTTATMTAMATGTPNLIQGLVRRFMGIGVM